MKAIHTLCLSLLLTLSVGAHARSIEVEVNGLVCAFCAQGIQKSVKKFPATEEVFVSLEHRLVAVQLKDGQDIADDALSAAITDAGYATVKITRTEDSVDAIRARVKSQAGTAP